MKNIDGLKDEIGCAIVIIAIAIAFFICSLALYLFTN